MQEMISKTYALVFAFVYACATLVSFERYCTYNDELYLVWHHMPKNQQ